MSTDESRRAIRRALISVYDKTGLVELAQGLSAAGVEIVRTPVRHIVTRDDGRVAGVELVDGRTLGADAVVVGARFRARADVFASAGLVAVPHVTGLGDARRKLLGAALARREEHDVEPAEVSGRGVLDGHLAVAPREGAARAAGGGEEPELVNGPELTSRAVALTQDAAHNATDLSRRAHNADPHGDKSTA